MIPCDAVGGDYLDFLTGEEFAGRGFGVAVGDVMGHGPAAALLMTAARACLRMRASRPGSLGEVVTDMNRHLAVDLGDVERFMTFYLLEVREDAVSWVSAGHEPALLVDPGVGDGHRPGGGRPGPRHRRGHRVPRASCPVPRAGARSWPCARTGSPRPGTSSGEQFGRERLKQSLLRHASQDASAILEGVMRDVIDFRGPAPQKDDLTLVVLKRAP